MDEDTEFEAGFYEEQFKRFDEWGKDSVLLKLSSGDMPAQLQEAARIWLKRKEREASPP